MNEGTVIRDVVIVGAGLAGSSLATVLGNLGWDVLLVERGHLPRHKVCGEFLSPEAQASIWAMDLYEAVAALTPVKMPHARLVGHRGASLRVALPGDAWGVSRFKLDAALVDAARRAGVEVQTGVSATAITATATGSSVELRTSQRRLSVRARAVVVACGRNPLAGLRASATSTRHPAAVGVKCHYTGVTMPPQVEMFLFPGGYAGLAPIEDGRVNLCLLASREAFARAGGTVRSMLDAAVRAHTVLESRLSGGTALPETEVAVAPVDTERTAVPWSETARLGDAATMIPPLCGDGMAMAFRSAELCAPLLHELLRDRLSYAAWQEAYQRAWHQEFDWRLRAGRRLQRLLSIPGFADVCLSLGNLIPPVAEYLVRATRGPTRPITTVPRIVRAIG